MVDTKTMHYVKTIPKDATSVTTHCRRTLMVGSVKILVTDKERQVTCRQCLRRLNNAIH